MKVSEERQKEYNEFFDRFKKSDLSVHEFCVKESICINTFYKRRKRLEILNSAKLEQSDRKSELKMLPVSVPLTTKFDHRTNYKIQFPDGIELAIPEHFNPAMAGELIRLCRMK